MPGSLGSWPTLQQRSGRLSQAAAPPTKHGQPTHGRDGSSHAQTPLMQLPTQQRSSSSLHTSPGAMQSGGVSQPTDAFVQTPDPPGSAPLGQQMTVPPPQGASVPVSQSHPSHGSEAVRQAQTPPIQVEPVQHSSSPSHSCPGFWQLSSIQVPESQTRPLQHSPASPPHSAPSGPQATRKQVPESQTRPSQHSPPSPQSSPTP